MEQESCRHNDEMRQEEEEWKKRMQVIIDRENAADFENAALSHTVFVL
jgi:predicted secreted protein